MVLGVVLPCVLFLEVLIEFCLCQVVQQDVKASEPHNRLGVSFLFPPTALPMHHMNHVNEMLLVEMKQVSSKILSSKILSTILQPQEF